MKDVVALNRCVDEQGSGVIERREAGVVDADMEFGMERMVGRGIE